MSDFLNASQIECLTKVNDICFYGKKHIMKKDLPPDFNSKNVEDFRYFCIWELVEEVERYEHDKKKNVKYTAWYDMVTLSHVLFEDDDLTAYISAFGTADCGKNAVLVNKESMFSKKYIWF